LLGGIDSSFDDWDETKMASNNQGRSNLGAYGFPGGQNPNYS